LPGTKRTLADLHTEQSRTHTIIESLPDGVLVTNPEGNVVLINPACYHHLDIDTDKNRDYPLKISLTILTFAN